MMMGPAALIAALLPTKRPAPMIPPMEIIVMCRGLSDRLSCSFTYDLLLMDGGRNLTGLTLVYQLSAQVSLIEIPRQQLRFRHGERIAIDDHEVRQLAGLERAL